MRSKFSCVHSSHDVRAQTRAQLGGNIDTHTLFTYQNLYLDIRGEDSQLYHKDTEDNDSEYGDVSDNCDATQNQEM